MKEEKMERAYQRLHRKETDEIVDYAYNLEQQNKQLQQENKALQDNYKKANKIIEQMYNEQHLVKLLQDKLEKIKEYLPSYKSICEIQFGSDSHNTMLNTNLDKNTMVEMTNRYLKVHDNILSILESEE